VNKKIKMKLFGLTLVILGMIILVYSILFGSSGMSFWTMYIGILMVATGLGFLGFNIGSYPI